MHRVGLAAVLACACYDSAGVAPCSVRCADSTECPGDLTCIQGICADDTAVCNDLPPPPPPPGTVCGVDPFDMISTMSWQTTPNPSIIASTDFGKLRFEIAPSASGETALTSVDEFDFTGKAMRLEIGQPPADGGRLPYVAFRLIAGTDVLDVSQAQNKITAQVLPAGAPLTFVPLDLMDGRFWEIRDATPAPGDPPQLEVNISADRSFVNKMTNTFTFPSLTSVRVEIAAGQNGADTQESAAEVDDFETFDATCMPLGGAPLARERFDNSTGPLEDSMVETPGAWAKIGQLAGGITVENGFADYDDSQGVTTPTFYAKSTPGPRPTDYDVEADVRWIAKGVGRAGLVAHGSAGNGYYFGVINNSTAELVGELKRLHDTVEETLVGTCMTQMPSLNEVHRLRLRVRGTELLGYFDGVLMCAAKVATDPILDEEPGIYAASSKIFQLDHFLSTAP